MIMKQQNRILLLAKAVLLAFVAATTQAQTYTWTSPTSGSANWSAASWNPGTPAAGGALGNTLNFANGTYTANNDLAGIYTLTTLNFNNGSGALALSGNDLQFDGGSSFDSRLTDGSTGALTLDNNIALAGTYNCYITPYGDITLNGVISGGIGGGIWVADGGAQVIFANANNSFTNRIGVLNNGSLVANSSVTYNANGPFGNASSSIMLPLSAGSSGTVGLYGGAAGVMINRRINASVLMGAGGKRIIGGLQASGYVTIANYIDGPAGQAVQFHAPAGAGLQINAGVIGSPVATSSIIYEGGGQFSVYAAGAGGNTYSGTTTVRAGYVYLNNNDTGSAGNYSLGSSPNTTTVQLGDALTPAGAPLTLMAGADLTINHDISVNNYGGTAVLGSSSTHRTTWNGNISLQKNVYLQDYTYGLDATTFAGQISGSGRVITTGNGVIVLSAANTYSGGTLVQANAALDVQHDGGLGTSNVFVMDTATLILESGTANSYINAMASLVLSGASPMVSLNYTGVNSIGALSFDGGGTFAATGTWGSATSGADHTDSRLVGTGLLNVTGVTGPTDTNTLARVMNAAYAPGLNVDGSGSDWAGLASSTLYMDTSANNVLPGQNLGVNIRYAWDHTNLYVLVAENTNSCFATNAVEAPDAGTYQLNPWSFDGIGFWLDLKNTCGLTLNGIKIAKDNADFQPWFGLSSSDLANLFYARANNTATMDLVGLATAKAAASGTFAAHNRKLELAIAWADVATAVATNQQPGGNIASAVAAGLKLGIEPLLILNFWDGQSFIGAGNKWNPPTGADTNSVDVQLISITTPPTLTVRLEAGQAVLRWPAAALNYSLWHSSVLGTGASWAVVETTPVADLANPGMLKVSLPASAAAQFYRLKQ